MKMRIVDVYLYYLLNEKWVILCNCFVWKAYKECVNYKKLRLWKDQSEVH